MSQPPPSDALANLFAPPPSAPPPPPPLPPLNERQTTQVTSNYQSSERTSLLYADDAAASAAFYDLKTWHRNHPLPPTSSSDASTASSGWWCQPQRRWWYRNVTNNAALATLWEPTTVAGALIFCVYHVVFCLAFASALQRPHAAERGMLGLMAKLTAIGIFGGAGFLYIFRLNADIPAVYPSVDLFLAPFIAQFAALVDESLWQAYGQQPYPDYIFLGTFAMLCTCGMALVGLFLWLGSTFKLANLGTYLPYSVLAGFFSAVGVLMWALAFAVDTTGKSWATVFGSGNLQMISNALLHHIPSLVVGILMNRLGPKNPFYVIFLLVATVVFFYGVMFITQTSLNDAQAAGWFWSVEELVYNPHDHISSNTTTTFVPTWSLPPAPLGSWTALLSGHVVWKAVYDGLGHMVALAFLYLLRSSIHASAMKKNVGNLVRRIPLDPSSHKTDDEVLATTADVTATARTTTTDKRPSSMWTKMSQSVRMVQMSMKNQKPVRMLSTRPDYYEIRASPPRRSLESIFSEYAYALFVVSFVGGFGVCPTVATSNTMYAIGAEKAAPQYGSIVLLVVFYMLDFRIVRYIPKTAFSSLLVLGAVDTFVVWFFGAYRKTQDRIEWLVVPFISIFSLVVGFLNAVFLGVGISMFVFVGSFFRVGVVKYNASGLEIRSRIERSVAQSTWLNENGDLCQVLVLQNYLFFGNACTILDYVATMFEEVDQTLSQKLDFAIAPFPKILVLDLSLVSGMDTSTIDIFGEMYEFCKNNECKLFFCGLSARMRKGLELGGVKPDTGPRSQSNVRFFADLDTALGRAEDSLIQSEMKMDSPRSLNRSSESLDGSRGLQRALQQIDDLHGLNYSQRLFELHPYMEVIDLAPGACLYECDGGVIKDSQRGLFLIEEGLLRIERDSTQSLTLTRTRGSIGSHANKYTLKNQHARMGTVARRAALAKGNSRSAPTNLRLARLGPGWVCGTLDVGAPSSGRTVCIAPARLHHLSAQSLEAVEAEDPSLALSLYKLVTHLRAYREEATIEQLTTLNNIMTSPAHSKPISRAARQAFGP